MSILESLWLDFRMGNTIRFNYKTKLVRAHHGIEAEWRVVKLAASSHLVHAPEHRCSISQVLMKWSTNASQAT